MLKLALTAPSRTIKVVNDQYGSPTWSYRLGLQIEKILEVDGQGVYHSTAEGYCSWYDLARCFLSCMNVEHDIEPCTTDQYPTPAKRPKNSILENARLKKAGINLMEDWRKDVDQFVRQYGKQLIQDVQLKES